MERLLEGDESSLEELVRRYQGPLYRLAYSILHDSASAEDAFQETFLKVYRRRFSYRPGSPVKPWIYQICMNVCRDHLRRAKRCPETPLEENPPPPGPGGFSPEECVEREEQARSVRQALIELPAKQREVLLLAHYQNLSYPEISILLDIPTGTVKSRVFHALKKLGALLSKKDS